MTIDKELIDEDGWLAGVGSDAVRVENRETCVSRQNELPVVRERHGRADETGGVAQFETFIGAIAGDRERLRRTVRRGAQ